MRSGPNQEYHAKDTETLADVRQYLSRYPDRFFLEPTDLANRLGHSAVEVTAALESLHVEGEVLP
jgi:hypothetical protein